MNWRVAGSTAFSTWVMSSRGGRKRSRAELIRGGADLIQLRGKKQSHAELTFAGGKAAPPNERRGRPLDYQRSSGNRPRCCARRRACRPGRCRDRPRARNRETRLLVGKSTHSLAQAIAAVAEGADYIGFGPLFATPTKPDYPPIGTDDIRRVHESVQLPIFCIGGIKLDNLPEVLAAGANRVVIVSGLLQSGDVAAATRAAKELLVENHKSEIQK